MFDENQLSDNHEIFIGYSIRKIFADFNRVTVLPNTIITIDTGLMPCHQDIEEPDWESYCNYTNTLPGIRLSLETVMDIYNHLDEISRINCVILGFSIKFKYAKNIYKYSLGNGKQLKFGYALCANQKPIGELVGYDVALNDSLWSSELFDNLITPGGFKEIGKYGKLNQHCLFDDFNAAEKYTIYCNSFENEPEGDVSPWAIYLVK